MAITLNPETRVISVPQADLTFISGTLYEMDTEVDFRQIINQLMDDEDYIWMPDPISHNTEVTVAGVTYARFIEMINSYSITFTPDSQWSVRLAGSNNNIFDIENGILNQNQVQVIPGNSAGLIVAGGGGETAAAIAAAVWALAKSTAEATPGSMGEFISDELTIIDNVLINRTETNPVTGVMTIFAKDDVTPLYTTNIWENVGATTPYGGNAVNRRDRLT